MRKYQNFIPPLELNDLCSLATGLVVLHSPVLIILCPVTLYKDRVLRLVKPNLGEELLRPYGLWLDVPFEQNYVLLLVYI